jgi:NAD(P)-dependent dehydrogenase (short-subunit alcohol dehydrogenase family)
VSLVSRDLQNLEQGRKTLIDNFAEAEGRVSVHAADLKDPASAVAALDAAEKAFGPVDVLVNSAGAARRTPPDDLTPTAWHDAMDAKYFTYIHMIDPVVKRMGQRGRGAIVNVIGQGGKVASPVHMAGGAANAALMLVSAGMAAAYAAKGVRVNAVNPGLTLTARLQEGMKADAKLQGIDTDEALKRATARLPLGRIATPEEIANTVVFLASPEGELRDGRDRRDGRRGHAADLTSRPSAPRTSPPGNRPTPARARARSARSAAAHAAGRARSASRS